MFFFFCEPPCNHRHQSLICVIYQTSSKGSPEPQTINGCTYTTLILWKHNGRSTRNIGRLQNEWMEETTIKTTMSFFECYRLYLFFPTTLAWFELLFLNSTNEKEEMFDF